MISGEVPQPRQDLYRIYTAPPASERYLNNLDPCFSFARIDFSKFVGLEKVAPFVLAIDAGAGHLRPLKALQHVLSKYITRADVKTLTAKTHSLGSNNPVGKWLMEMQQRHCFFQDLIAAPLAHHLALRQDTKVVVETLKKLIEVARSEDKNEVMLIHTNPDPAYISGHRKFELEKEENINICNVLVITDHFPTHPQFIWNLIDMDIIVAPDEVTAVTTEKELQRWAKKMKKPIEKLPRVITCGFLQEPFFTCENEEFRNKRLRQTLPESVEKIDVAIPLGGASPGMPFLGDLVKKLHDINFSFNPWSVRKKNGRPMSVVYDEALIKAEGQVVEVDNNDELIDIFGERFISENRPTAVIVKPGELSNLMLFSPKQTGGAIMLLTEPVGDQEKQNKLYFQSKYGGSVLPTDHENQQLVGLVYRNINKDQIDGVDTVLFEQFKKQAVKWRGVSLPPDPKIAADFIYGLKKFGIMHAMAQYEKYDTVPDGQKSNGVFSFMEKIAAVYREINEKSN